jgi:hypothetical protein
MGTLRARFVTMLVNAAITRVSAGSELDLPKANVSEDFGEQGHADEHIPPGIDSYKSAHTGQR